MKLALWQGPSPSGNPEQAFSDLTRATRGAGAMEAAMLVAPEVFLPGYNHDHIAELAQPRGGEWHRRLAKVARDAGCGLTCGYAERDGEMVYNSAAAFDSDGKEIAHYRKIQLYGPREKALYRPGNRYEIFDLHGTRTALLICYDIEFAPHIAALSAQGVQLILCPTANMQPFTHVIRFTVPAHAANHALAIVYANYCATEGDLTYVGGSLIADPYGEPLVQAGQGPALLVADLATRLDAARLSTQALDFKPV